MAIAFKVAPHPAEPVSPNFEQLSAPSDLLLHHLHSQIKPNRSRNRARQPNSVDVLQSSFIDTKRDGWWAQEGLKDEFQMADARTQNNGFVKTVVEAYNGHHHLVIRPDDVWIAILTQLSVYVNANSKELRSLFVKHKGKKTSRIYIPGNRRTVDFGSLAVQMTDEIQKNILDPALQQWVLPSFTTTTPTDTTICSVLLMSTMKAYFEYDMSLCGIPSITLEGTKSDWEALLQKLDKLPSFRPSSSCSKNSESEPERWANLLRPVLRRFVDAFTRAESGLEPDVDFWSKIANRYSFGSGTSFLSGWITAFCVWDSTTGKWQGSPRSSTPQRYLGSTPKSHAQLVLDDVTYPVIDTHKVPMGYCEVDVKVRDAEGEVDCVMVAGHMASLVRGESKDTLAPLASWFMYIRPEEVESDTTLLDEGSRTGKSSSEMLGKATQPSCMAKLRKFLCSA
ncbi:unnamed protein product [Cyclocybe aegerita]|uniref:Uncharacterized protein n=1 Tax=Cyclocybe aegerita TaxID=1973307 RepID=A0A8S0W6S5_CYCAE|nr:unnamed protein product [Cyclocybe aegerita]